MFPAFAQREGAYVEPQTGSSDLLGAGVEPALSHGLQ